jgi:hypothetical protein
VEQTLRTKYLFQLASPFLLKFFERGSCVDNLRVH